MSLENFTTPLSSRQVVGLLVGAAVLGGLGYPVREYVYPWLGLPVIGASGLTPFFFAWACVVFVLLQFHVFRSREVLTLVVSVPAAIGLATLSMLALARYFA